MLQFRHCALLLAHNWQALYCRKHILTLSQTHILPYIHSWSRNITDEVRLHAWRWTSLCKVSSQSSVLLKGEIETFRVCERERKTWTHALSWKVSLSFNFYPLPFSLSLSPPIIVSESINREWALEYTFRSIANLEFRFLEQSRTHYSDLIVQIEFQVRPEIINSRFSR